MRVLLAAFCYSSSRPERQALTAPEYTCAILRRTQKRAYLRSRNFQSQPNFCCRFQHYFLNRNNLTLHGYHNHRNRPVSSKWKVMTRRCALTWIWCAMCSCLVCLFASHVSGFYERKSLLDLSCCEDDADCCAARMYKVEYDCAEYDSPSEWLSCAERSMCNLYCDDQIGAYIG